jgi:hypothetical protein
MFSIVDVILDSSNTTVSFTSNFLSFKYINPNLLLPPDDGDELLLVTILAIALDVCPITFSPKIALDSTLALEGNERISKVGEAVVLDS